MKLAPGEPALAAKSQEHLLEPATEAVTPSRERKLQAFFQKSPAGDSDLARPPNKLRKKRFPSSANPSAQSSTSSLPHSSAVSPSVEVADPLEESPVAAGCPCSEGGSYRDAPNRDTCRAHASRIGNSCASQRALPPSQQR